MKLRVLFAALALVPLLTACPGAAPPPVLRHIYIADSENYRIVRMDDMNGTNWTAFGAWGSGQNQFGWPWAVFIR
ncbi:MAG: hypothetical protein KGZ57_06025 [Dethiobacter sp.]|nr:hypothetical protein [Dethiobacter sp.]